MDGVTQQKYEHSTSSELQGPLVNLTYRRITQHNPACSAPRAGACWALPSCLQVLPRPSPRGEEGAYINTAFGVVIPLACGRCGPRNGVCLGCPLGGGSASAVTVPVPAAPLWCDLFLCEGRRAGLGVDGGGCRGGVWTVPTTEVPTTELETSLPW